MLGDRLDDPAAYRLEAGAPECDMVMKGGITSGVVYPRAACRLATQYRLRRLGGSSAGAIAAALAAVAEHGRAHRGFVKLNRIPTELGAALATLFQPSKDSAPAFDILLAAIEPGWGAFRKLRRGLWLLARHAKIAWSVTLVLAMLPALAVAMVAAGGGPAQSPEWMRVARALLLWLPVAVAAAFLGAALVLAVRTLKALPANDYGLCDGHTRRSQDSEPPLTDWMTTTLDRLSGPRSHAGPLTFGDLWGKDAAQAYLDAVAPDEGEAQLPARRLRELRDMRQLDVEMMTTNLTHRRPYRFPFDSQLFHWCLECFRTYFPAEVLSHMERHSSEVPDERDEGADPPAVISKMCPRHPNVRLRYQPRTAHMPLVVAARLSLSFPGLISAVPLYAVDWSAAAGRRRIETVWFSDGGIASNFPMHFFDSAWPRRPTFGINLMPRHPHFPDQMVWRARSGASGILPRVRPPGSMLGFLRAIFDTMQNWVDNTQVTMPGFRDRVVEVRQRKEEGGMNLRMRPSTIEKLADRGAEAAAELETFDLELHRWIRYRVSMSGLDDLFDTMAGRYGGPDGYRHLVESYGPTTNHYRPQDLPADADATRRLMDTAAAWEAAGHPATGGRVPRPRPELRQVPRQ